MEKLKEVAHISGKSGLYRIIKPTRTGVIVETLDDRKEKTVVGSNARVSVMNEISVFMDDHQDSSKPLALVLAALNLKYPNGLDFAPKELSEQKLIECFLEIEPNFDREKVYPSDIKKILSWFVLLKKNLPEIFTEITSEISKKEAEEVKVDEVKEADEKPKKTKAKAKK